MNHLPGVPTIGDFCTSKTLGGGGFLGVLLGSCALMWQVPRTVLRDAVLHWALLGR
jgi:hypothetical protein